MSKKIFDIWKEVDGLYVYQLSYISLEQAKDWIAKYSDDESDWAVVKDTSGDRLESKTTIELLKEDVVYVGGGELRDPNRDRLPELDLD
jgi:hypothetical protein